MICPSNISLTPREQIYVAAQGNPSSYLNNAHPWFDMKCSYTFHSTEERNEVDDHEPWTALSVFGNAGLEGFVAKTYKRDQGNFIGVSGTGFVTKDNVIYQIQTGQDEEPFDCSQQDEVPPEAFTPILNTMLVKDIHPYRDFEYDSKRKDRRKIMLGELAEFSGQVRMTISEFSEFLIWYVCRVSSGLNTFKPLWLDNTEVGTWEAHWASPWTASHEVGKDWWLINISLLLTEISE